MNIAIMTARSNSKSIPHKNIRMLGPLPLLGWGISALSKSTKIDKIILSTDSEEYLEIGKSINSKIIFHKRFVFSDVNCTILNKLIFYILSVWSIFWIVI